MTLHLPQGFRYAGCYCGIKANTSAKDLSLVVSDRDAVAAGVYTQNQVVAAPVVNCRAKTPSSKARIVLVNSGNANACTGKQGAQDADAMCDTAARQVSEQLGESITAAQVLVMSTGIIGHHLPMAKVNAGILQSASQLSNSESSFYDAVDGILTTDKFRKVGSRRIDLGQGEVTLTGMAKGAGMIGPNMATMLCTIATDVTLTQEQAQRLLGEAANVSFNNVTVEGHTSTNDTMLLMANGASELLLASEQEPQFLEALKELSIELAKMIPTDGEGASHLVEVRVTGAKDDAAARVLALSVASSNLVKTAIHGNDPNWGRIVSAAGYAGPELDQAFLKLAINGHVVFDGGEPTQFDEAAVSHSMRDNSEVLLELVVGPGSGQCTHWTSDLTVEYVRFNSDYST